ncbi:MAG: MarR family transcriptional regulator [Gemmatimonadetes bacterium]|nr:MarR family transcriptional regulator [Gemmatimonadota bacterium]
MVKSHPTEIASRLHSAAIHLLRRARLDDPAMELTPARASALSVLVFGGARSLGELAAAEQVTPPTMSRLVSWFERAGYVTREAGAADGRVVTVRATPKAVRALESGRRRRVEYVRALLGGLSEAEWGRVERVVALLEDALSAQER